MPASPTRAEELADRIAGAILSGDFPPGLHLDEQVLARRYGVSRTPVRDALRLLVGTGLVRIRPHVGVTVTTVTPDELDMLFIAMGEVEASCARLAALSMTAPERGELRALHERMGLMAEASEHDAYADANLAFHGLLYAGAHNTVVEEVAMNLRRRLIPFRRAQFRAPGRLARSHAEHGSVLRALLSRDAAGANTAMLIHMSIVEDAFEAVDAGSARQRAEAREGRSGGSQRKGAAEPSDGRDQRLRR